MDLQEIEKKLKEKGYKPFLHEQRNCIYCEIDDKKGGTLPDSICQIRKERNNYICNYFDAQLPREFIFETPEKLFDLIQERFPIK